MNTNSKRSKTCIGHVRRKYILAGTFLSSFSLLFYACQEQQQLDFAQYKSNGKDLYVVHCQNCHGEKGEGLAELAPPLTDTLFMKANAARLACIIKNGMSGEIEINNTIYNEKMPAFPDLMPIDIAQLRVYISNAFGNQQGMYTYEQVINDLANCSDPQTMNDNDYPPHQSQPAPSR